MIVSIRDKKIDNVDSVFSQLSSCINTVKIKLSDAFGKKTTLCITPTEVDTSTGNTTTLLRTAKVMRASLAGIPIVSPRWVHLCEEEKAAVVPRSNEVAQSMPTKVHAIATNGDSILGVARMAAQLALKSPSPLHNYFVFFCGTFAAKQRKDLQLLAREAGAKVLPTPSAVLSKLGIAKVILLCHDVSTGSVVPSSLVEHVRTTLTKNDSSVLVVNTQWIFESITCARAVPLNAFPPVNIKAKELWQLGNQD